MFSSRNFIGLDLAFRSMVHFVLIFIYVVQVMIEIYLFIYYLLHTDIQFL